MKKCSTESSGLSTGLLARRELCLALQSSRLKAKRAAFNELVRMSERIGNPGKPGVVSSCTPVVQPFAHIRHDGCVRGVGGKVYHFVRIGIEIVQLFGRAMRKSIQRAFTELRARSAHDRLPGWR